MLVFSGYVYPLLVLETPKIWGSYPKKNGQPIWPWVGYTRMWWYTFIELNGGECWHSDILKEWNSINSSQIRLKQPQIRLKQTQIRLKQQSRCVSPNYCKKNSLIFPTDLEGPYVILRQTPLLNPVSSTPSAEMPEFPSSSLRPRRLGRKNPVPHEHLRVFNISDVAFPLKKTDKKAPNIPFFPRFPCQTWCFHCFGRSFQNIQKCKKKRLAIQILWMRFVTKMVVKIVIVTAWGTNFQKLS